MQKPQLVICPSPNLKSLPWLWSCFCSEEVKGLLRAAGSQAVHYVAAAFWTTAEHTGNTATLKGFSKCLDTSPSGRWGLSSFLMLVVYQKQLRYWETDNF